jgi:hypothetical protein
MAGFADKIAVVKGASNGTSRRVDINAPGLLLAEQISRPILPKPDLRRSQ